MSTLLFGALCAVGGAVAAAVFPKVFTWASNLVTKAKAAKADLDD